MNDPWSLTAEDALAAEQAMLRTEFRLITTVGLFFRWFAAVEIQLDRNLCHILGIRDFEAYAILSGSSTPNRKIGRIKQALTKQKSKLPRDMEERLDFFGDKIVPIRNNLAHNYIFSSESGIVIGKMDRMPDMKRNPVRPRRIEPLNYEFDYMRKVNVWLNDFWHDLNVMADETWKLPLPRTIEIAEFRSRLPTKG